MKFKIHRAIEDCRSLWDTLSQNNRLFDVWDYRMCFCDNPDNEPYFIAGQDNGETVGMLPLHFIKSSGQYTYFGGWFTAERNSFFLKDKTKLAELLEQCPRNTVIEGLDPDERRYYNFAEDEYTFYLDLARYGYDFENYFGSLGSKRQKNIKRDLKNIPDYEVYRNRLEDFDRLVELNIKQYEEDSKFNDPSIRNGIHKMINLAHKNSALEMMSLEINGRVEAVDFGIVHGNCYYAVIGGSNNQKIPGLGKLMTVLDIKNAIARKSRFVDFFATSGHWKSAWNFEKEMLLKFVK